MSEQIISTEGFHCVDNARIYDLAECLIAAGYPMRTAVPDMTNTIATSTDIERCTKLSKATISTNNQAHDQFLTGIRVSFDLRCSNKMWVECERYRFLEFVSSQSTMHRIAKFDIKNQYNKYVDPAIVAIMEQKVENYNILNEARSNLAKEGKVDAELNEVCKELYLEILYNNPAGFELTARMTTNYRCLKNIYRQRKDHRLPEWREFCSWIETLPFAHELILCDS